MNNNKHHLWQSLYETILKKLESEFPDWLKNTHSQDRLEIHQDAAINVAIGFSDIAVYGEYKHCTEIDLYESKKILHKSGIKTPKMPDGKLSEQRIGELVTNEHSVEDATNKLLSLRNQLSSAIDEIDAVVGKNGQIQQNIDAHEKQTEEITQNQKFSDPTL